MKAHQIREVGSSHIGAFPESDGVDHDCSIWCAERVQERRNLALGVNMTVEALATQPLAVAAEHSQQAKGAELASHYVTEFMKRNR